MQIRDNYLPRIAGSLPKEDIVYQFCSMGEIMKKSIKVNRHWNPGEELIRDIDLDTIDSTQFSNKDWN